MPVLELALMTWEEVRGLDKARAVAILPIGAIEAHGPHLPLNTDVIIAEAMARSGAERLAAKGRAAVILPSLAYTAAPFAQGFAGTLPAEGRTITALLLQIADGLARHGFPMLSLANAHLDPAHLDSLENAVTDIRAEGRLKIAFPSLGRKPWALRLTDEFKSGACHAGQFETSVVMAVRPELVREAIRRVLPPNPSSIGTALREGKRSFEAANGPRAYFGFPAEASAAEGRRTIEILGAILEESVVLEVGP